ncbi:MAG: hypothetical protein M0R80_27380 [Proteobacteria bacterium]|nr:hypothetical protein [Pseudomonadota bacterium]
MTTRNRSLHVIFGPPGLFLGLTLAALVAGIWIVRSTTAAAVQNPPPATAATP